MIAGLLLNALFGIFQVNNIIPYIIDPNPSVYWKQDIYGNRLDQVANGLFITPNNLGSALIPPIVLLFSIFVYERNNIRTKVVLAPIFIVIAAGLFATYQKGGYIWAGVGMILVLIPERIRLPASFLIFAATTLAIIAYGRSLAVDPKDTLYMRTLLWEAAMQNISQNPSILLLGNGMENMPYWGGVIARWVLKSSHNSWIDQILFYGVPGLLLYSALWVNALVKSSIPVARELPISRAIRIGLFAALFALAGNAFFEPRSDGVFQIAQVFLIIAMIECQLQISKFRNDSRALLAGVP